jgi:polysaccharide export outer membrane protein
MRPRVSLVATSLLAIIVLSSSAVAQYNPGTSYPGSSYPGTSSPSRPGVQTSRSASQDRTAQAPKKVEPDAKPPQAPSGVVTQASAPNLVIGGGDLLEISVYGAADFDKKEVRVSGNGDVILPLIGTQHVAGLDIDRAQQLIATKLAEGQFFNNPQVSIFVKEYATQGVSVLGEVQKPGVYPLLGARRLFDAISQAGGLTAKAGKVVTITRREHSSAPQTINLGNDLLASTEGNVEVQPGDTIMVSKAGIVYVVGDVKMPGGFVIENGKMTVLQALAMAQGANPTASLNSAKIIHNQDGKQQDTDIPLKKILSAKASDMPLQPEDILFVPGSAGRSVLRRSMEAIVQTATGVAIYRR